MQPDTIIPDLSNPQSWNRYSYVTNRPVNFNDPTGHAGCKPGKRCTANPFMALSPDPEKTKEWLGEEYRLNLQGEDWTAPQISSIARGAIKFKETFGANVYNKYIASTPISVLPSFGHSRWDADNNTIEFSYTKLSQSGDILSGTTIHELVHPLISRSGRRGELIEVPFDEIGWDRSSNGEWTPPDPATGPTDYSRGNITPIKDPEEDAAETVMVSIFPKLKQYPLTKDRSDWYDMFVQRIRE